MEKAERWCMKNILKQKKGSCEGRRQWFRQEQVRVIKNAENMKFTAERKWSRYQPCGHEATAEWGDASKYAFISPLIIIRPHSSFPLSTSLSSAHHIQSASSARTRPAMFSRRAGKHDTRLFTGVTQREAIRRCCFCSSFGGYFPLMWLWFSSGENKRKRCSSVWVRVLIENVASSHASFLSLMFVNWHLRKRAQHQRSLKRNGIIDLFVLFFYVKGPVWGIRAVFEPPK